MSIINVRNVYVASCLFFKTTNHWNIYIYIYIPGNVTDFDLVFMYISSWHPTVFLKDRCPKGLVRLIFTADVQSTNTIDLQ